MPAMSFYEVPIGCPFKRLLDREEYTKRKKFQAGPLVANAEGYTGNTAFVMADERCLVKTVDLEVFGGQS